MQPNKITDQLSVSGQISPEDVSLLKDAGFRTIICNRPDGEKEGQPSANEIEAAATSAGLAFYHNPMVPDQISPDIVAKQGEILASAEGPVFAYCGSGKRASVLWVLANPDGLDADKRISLAAIAGHDLSPLRPRL